MATQQTQTLQPPIHASAVADEQTIAVMHGAIENLSRHELDLFERRVFAYLAAGIPSRLIMRFDEAALAVELIRRRAMGDVPGVVFGEAA
ncbi:MAG: hypothetical protein WDN46_14105 [Methylocella sp.]